jgi:hypothetical protein
MTTKSPRTPSKAKTRKKGWKLKKSAWTLHHGLFELHDSGKYIDKVRIEGVEFVCIIPLTKKREVKKI